MPLFPYVEIIYAYRYTRAYRCLTAVVGNKDGVCFKLVSREPRMKAMNAEYWLKSISIFLKILFRYMFPMSMLSALR